MRRLPAALLLLALSAPLSADDQAAPAADHQAQQEEPSEREARLTTVEGAVYVHLHDQADGEFIAAEEGSPIEAGDLVRTGTDGHAEVALDGESVIDLAPNTDFLVTSLAPEQTEFHLGIGSIAAKIKSLLPGQKMSFRTVKAVAAVRGTELGVTQQSDAANAEVGVFDEGRVSVTSAEGRGEVKLGPGEECEVAKGRGPGKPRALKAFDAQRQRMAALRQRQQFHFQNWRRMAMGDRMARRQQLRQRQALRAERLQRVRADMLQRRYARQQARRKSLENQFQRLRRQREFRQRQQDQRQKLQQPQQRKQEQQRQTQIQEQRRQQAEQHRQELQKRRQTQNQQRRESERRERVEQEKWRQGQAERQRQQEERYHQAQERRQERKRELQEERQKEKQERRQRHRRPNGS